MTVCVSTIQENNTDLKCIHPPAEFVRSFLRDFQRDCLTIILSSTNSQLELAHDILTKISLPTKIVSLDQDHNITTKSIHYLYSLLQEINNKGNLTY